MGTPISLCSAEELQTLTDITNFEESEIASMYHRFVTENPDGRLSQSRFRRIMKGLGFESKQFIDAIFSGLVDHTKRHYLTFSDIVTALSMIERGSNIEKVQIAFRLWRPPSAFVPKVEMLAFMERLKAVIDVGDQSESYTTIVGNEMRSCLSSDRKVRVSEYFHRLMMNKEFISIIHNSNPSQFNQEDLGETSLPRNGAYISSS